jgi:hypothetical protein
MWFLVSVERGNKHYEPDSQTGNRVLMSDTSEMVISCRSTGGNSGYRFEARKGNESFIVAEYPGISPEGLLAAKFAELTQQVGAVAMAKGV